ncbi:hypothetical protein E4U45_003190 [Claviceps purpurea]|nr:hypothetical protein E4U45_003190 [Claviceps purpurea]
MRVTFPTRSPLRALPCPKWGLNAIGQCQRYHIRTFEKTPDALGNVRDVRTSSRSLTLPPSADPPHSPRLARDAEILIGESPDNLLRNPRISHTKEVESPDNLLRNPRISHTKEVHGNVRNAHTPSRSLTLPPRGTGKTFLYETLACHYRSEGKTVICAASTGIAALLLPGGLLVPDTSPKRQECVPVHHNLIKGHAHTSAAAANTDSGKPAGGFEEIDRSKL